MIEVSVQGNALHIKSGYEDKDRVKMIPGRRWDAARKIWKAPATFAVARQLVEIFGLDMMDTSPEFDALLADAQKAEDAQKLRGADGLEQPPLRRLDAWRHQLQAYHFVMPQRAALLDMWMGTGKSRVTVDIVINRGHEKVLIVCPKSVMAVWPDEFRKHAGHDKWAAWNERKGTCAKRAAGMDQFLRLCKARGEIAVCVVNYEAVWREDFARVVMRSGFDLVVLDESHKAKSPSGAASRFLGKLGDAVPYRLCLSGTPTPHSPLDIYGQYRFLDKGIFGTSFVLFRARYALMGGFEGKQVTGYQNEEELKAKVDSIAYRAGQDVIELPDAVHTYRTVELTPLSRRAYEQMEKTFIADVAAGRVVASNAMSKLLRLQQITSGYLPNEGNGDVMKVGTEKRAALVDLLDDLPKDEPVVVFARFRHDLDQIRDAVEESGRRYAELSGRVNQLAHWQDGGADVIGVQIQAGGVGISLVRARYCVYYSMGFSLGDYTQSLARVHRPGQDKNVTYIHIVAEDTVDERVYRALQARQDVIDDILYGGRRGPAIAGEIKRRLR